MVEVLGDDVIGLLPVVGIPLPLISYGGSSTIALCLSVGFLLAIKPDLEGKVLLALALVLPALTLLWWVDPFRVRLRTAATGFAACASG